MLYKSIEHNVTRVYYERYSDLEAKTPLGRFTPHYVLVTNIAEKREGKSKTLKLSMQKR